MASQEHISYQLENWKIYPDKLLLQSGRQEVQINDKNMQVLLSLIKAEGEVVLKEEFFK